MDMTTVDEQTLRAWTEIPPADRRDAAREELNRRARKKGEPEQFDMERE
jgi:uncharacterized protein YbaA (DUF1428 family)